MPEGAHVFVAVAREPYGKQVWATIGKHDDKLLPIEKAREQARGAIDRIQKGLPPVEPVPVKPDTFQAVAEEWLKRHVVANGLRSRDEVERVLKKLVLPLWAQHAFIDIKRSDVARLLDHIQDHHGPSAADHALAIVRGISGWYATRHDTYATPFVRGMRRTNPKSRSRDRTLNDDELRKIWKAAEAHGQFGAFIQILLLTAQRRGDAVAMKWDDLKPGGVWEIPPEERAKGSGGALQLPEAALAIINVQPRLTGSEYVFAAARGNGPLSGFNKRKAAFDKACGVTDWVLHDLRRTARSLMSRAGVRPDIAERTLGHVIAGVEGVYDRHRYAVEKADALSRLATLIEKIVYGEAGANVRAFPAAVQG
jgi:integrase